MTYWLAPFVLQSIVLGHLFGALTLMFGFSHSPQYRGGILVVLWRPWFAKRWRYSTTIGHCVAMHPAHGQRVWFHETEVHIHQFEDLCLLGDALALLLFHWVDWRVSLILWATSGAPWLVLNFISGWIRYGDPYWGSEHERAAYAITAQEYRK